MSSYNSTLIASLQTTHTEESKIPSEHRVVDAASIAARYPNAKRSRQGWKIPCPAHRGEHPNCYIADGDHGLIAKCWSHDCDYKEIVTALGVHPAWQERHWTATYNNIDGKPRHTYRWTSTDGTKRIAGKGSPKGCLLLTWGEDHPTDTLVIVEGEKAAKALQEFNFAGYTPVSWRGGCKTVGDQIYTLCQDRTVIIWPDNDAEGRTAGEIAGNMANQAGACDVKMLKVSDLPPKWDVADLTREQAIRRLSLFTDWQPEKRLFGWTVVSVVENDRDGFRTCLDDMGIELRDNLRSLQTEARNTRESEGFLSRLGYPDGWIPVSTSMRQSIYAECAVSYRMHDAKKGKLKKARWTDREDNFAAIAHETREDPWLTYLQSLTWDGTSRLDCVLSILFGLDAGDEYIHWASRFLFLGSVWRTFEPGCKIDEMVILVGPQGTGKSTYLREALPPEYQMSGFSDSLKFGVDSQKMQEALQGKIIVEASEMVMDPRQTDTIKAFLSRREDNARLAYRRDPIPHPRRCIIMGTSNQLAVLPNDLEYRRFRIVEIKRGRRIEDSMLVHDRDQLWAEAVQWYKEGEHPSLPRSMYHRAHTFTQQYRPSDDILDGATT